MIIEGDPEKFLTDFYSKKNNEEISQEKLDSILSTYGDNYDMLISDLYSKYDPEGLDDSKLATIKESYKLAPEESLEQKYLVNGFEVDKAGMIKRLYNDEFVERFQKGEITVDIENDSKLKAIANQQKNSGDAWSDAYESLENGASLLMQGIIGAETYLSDGLELLTGVKEAPVIGGFVSSIPKDVRNSISKELIDKVEKNELKIRATEGDFVSELSNGNFSRAAKMGLNTTLQSAPLMVASIGAAYATGGSSTALQALAGATTMTALITPAEYVQTLVSEDPNIQKLSKEEKFFRGTARGLAEGVPEGLMGPIGLNGGKILLQGLKGLVKKASIELGETTAKGLAKELGKETSLEIVQAFGLGTAAEGVTEFTTSLAQDLTDDFLGVQNLGFEEYLRRGANAGALGVFMGGVVQSSGIALNSGKNTLLRNNSVKQGAISEIRKEQELGIISKQQGDELIKQIDELQQAVDQTDSELSNEQQEKITNLIYRKNELNNRIKGLDPSQASVKKAKKEIEAIDKEIAETSASEADIDIATKKASVGESIIDLRLNKTIKFLEAQGKKLGKRTYTVEDEFDANGNLVKSAGEKAQEIYDEYVKENPGTKPMDVSNEEAWKVGDIAVINKNLSKQRGAISVGSHETFHFLVDDYFEGVDIEDRRTLIKDFKNLLSKKQLEVVNKRIQDAYMTMEGFDPETSIEWFTAFSDAIELNEITFNENIGNKILNFVQEILRKLGIKKEFENARQAYNFMKDYSKSVSKGQLSKRALKLSKTSSIKKGISFSKSEVTDLAKQYKADPNKADVEKLVKQYNNVALKALGYDISKGTIAPEEAISFVNKEFDSILRRYDGSTEFSTWINSNIRPKRQAFYEEQIGKQSETTSIDSEQARQVVDDSETTTDDRTEKEIRQAERKTKVAKRLKLEEKAIKEVSEKVKDIDLSKVNYKTLKNLANETIGEAFGISPKKILSNANLTKGEIANAQRYIKNNVDLLKALLPDGYNKDFKSTGVPKVLLDKFYNKRSVRSKTGAGLNVQIKKPNIGSTEFLEVFGFVDGKPTRNDRNISARIIALANQTGKAITNQTVREQLQKEGMPESALQDIKSGTPVGMFSKTVDGIINIRNLFQLEANGKDKLLKAYGLKKSLKIKNEEDINEYVKMLKSDIFILGPKEMWFGPSGGSVFTSSSKIIGVKSSSDPLWKTFVTKIKELESDNSIKYGKPIPGVNTKDIWSLRNKYDKFFKSPEIIEKNIKNGEIKKFNKQVAAIHKALWERINKEISKDNNKATGIATYLGIVANDTGHWHKLGAQFEGYSKDITGKRYEYEHAMPATAAYLYLLDASLSEVDFNTAYDLVVDNYKLIALDKAMDDKLRNARTDKGYSLQRRMPDDWSVIDNSWWQRYFNDIVSSQDGGIDPNSIIGLDGKTFGKMFNVDANGNSTTIEVEKLKSKAKNINVKNLSNNVVNFSKTTNNEGVIGYAKTIDEALKIARDPNAPVKKIRVFDFDDTLATTKSDVLFTAPDGTEGKLNAEEFAKQGAQLLEEGYVFDFSEFNKVTKGKPGPLLDIAKKIQTARGTEDVFVLTARAPEAQVAIKEFLDSVGLNIPLENITGLGNSTGEAKASWMVEKAAEGYNDFYFADDAYQNVKAVKDAMSVLDVKSKVQQAKIKFSKSVNEDFNKIIEQTTGIASEKVYSEAKAKVRGANKGNKKFFIPYSAEDFMGLIYPLLSKGKLGDSQMAWFKKNLLDPYAMANENIAADRIQLMEDFKALKKALEVPKDLRKKTDSGFTKEQAVRVYLFNKAGFDIPGISKTDLNELLDLVNSDGVLKAFGDQIFNITKGDGYAKPGENWLVGTITTDLIDVLNTVKRAKYLEQSGYTANAELIFSKENLNKLEAEYGAKYREALENVLGRMKSGKNRIFSGNRLSNRVLDYINNSTGAIMFFNTRSAVLQTISAINFLNWSFNNPIKAGAAFANQPQYWKDFVELINSDYLVDRRNGLKLNINESEIADAASTSKNKAKAAINYILQKGFLPTQFADSFAIASGGATFYRNRIKDLIKNEGMSEADAKKQAMLEWRETAEISQQSSDPSKISAQQASDLGRVILAFANTPMQYARIQKRALQDIVNGRGDAKTHVSKIIYYAVVQNLIFNALQSALFGLGFGDDEDDEKKEKMYTRIANGMLDSQLRGLGVAGATVAVIKNFLTDIYERSGRKRPEYVDSIYKLLQISPPVSSKISKIRGAAWQFDSKKRREEIFEKGFSIDNPAYEAGAKVISATANIPLDRVYSKVNNISGAMDEDAETWQTVAMLAGWPKWQIMPKDKKQEQSKFKNGNVEIITFETSVKDTKKEIKKNKPKRKKVKLKFK